MPYFKRDLSNILKKAIAQFKVILLTGARQSGKSTLLKAILPEYNYVSLDDIETRRQANEDPDLFLKYNECPLIIDEIQNAPDLLSYIKKKVDNEQKEGAFVLTGSQQFNLMADVHESLAGRMAVLSLNPFSVQELYSKEVPLWSKIVLKGLYPEPNIKEMDRTLWFDSYIDTILNKDIRANIKKEHIKVYDQFIKLIALRSSQELNFASLSKELGVSKLTVQSWIALLEKSQLIYLVPPYHNNLGKRIVKSQKLYFLDPGIVSHLTGHASEEQIQKGPMSGALFEGLVLSELVKFFNHQGKKPSIYFFRDNNGLEVDFIIEYKGQVIATEVKLTATPKKEYGKSLEAFVKLKPDSKAYLLCNKEEAFQISDNVQTSHWSRLATVL